VVSSATGIPKFLTTLGIVGLIFKGADPNQVPAAQVEQAFEAAGDDFLALLKAKYITTSEALTAIQACLAAGIQYFNNMLATDPVAKADPRPFKNGLANMRDKSFPPEVAEAKTINVVQAIPWDPAAAAKLYLQPGLKGWYSDSLAAGIRLVENYMAAIRAAVGSSTNAPAEAAAAALVLAVTVAAMTDSVLPIIFTIPVVLVMVAVYEHSLKLSGAV
jgi:hypothetical protein